MGGVPFPQVVLKSVSPRALHSRPLEVQGCRLESRVVPSGSPGIGRRWQMVPASVWYILTPRQARLHVLCASGHLGRAALLPVSWGRNGGSGGRDRPRDPRGQPGGAGTHPQQPAPATPTRGHATCATEAVLARLPEPRVDRRWATLSSPVSQMCCTARLSSSLRPSPLPPLERMQDALPRGPGTAALPPSGCPRTSGCCPAR